MTPKTFSAVPLPTPEKLAASKRAVIEFGGLDQSGPSYEGRIFLNNPGAAADTPQTPEEGYAGCFHMYSYGMKPEPASGQPTQGTALLPMRRQIAATDAIKRAIAAGSAASVTLVPVTLGAAQQSDPVVVDNVRIFTDDSAAATPY